MNALRNLKRAARIGRSPHGLVVLAMSESVHIHREIGRDEYELAAVLRTDSCAVVVDWHVTEDAPSPLAPEHGPLSAEHASYVRAMLARANRGLPRGSNR